MESLLASLHRRGRGQRPWDLARTELEVNASASARWQHKRWRARLPGELSTDAGRDCADAERLTRLGVRIVFERAAEAAHPIDPIGTAAGRFRSGSGARPSRCGRRNSGGRCHLRRHDARRPLL